MNSRQRFLNALRFQPVDHTPLYLRLWSTGGGPALPPSSEVDQIPFLWREQVLRAEGLLALGVDDTLLLQPPLGYTEEYNANLSPGVRRAVVEQVEQQGAAVLVKRYQTPAGELTQAVKLSADWPHGRDIPLFSDFSISRQVQPLVKRLEDVKCLPALLARPTTSQMADFLAKARQVQTEAGRLGVALDGGWSALGDSAVWLCGMEGVLYGQTDQPALLEALLDVLLEWELQRAEQVLQQGVDCWVHMAWYEGVDFWSPKNFRRLLRPRLQQLIDKAHAHGVPFRYIITKGWKPLRKDFLEMGIDCICGVDPLQDKVDLAEVKRELGGKISLMGGMNAAVTLALGSEAEIRQAVDRAIAALAPGGGFVLFPVDNIFCELPWEKTEIVIDQWKKHW